MERVKFVLTMRKDTIADNRTVFLNEVDLSKGYKHVSIGAAYSINIMVGVIANHDNAMLEVDSLCIFTMERDDLINIVDKIVNEHGCNIHIVKYDMWLMEGIEIEEIGRIYDEHRMRANFEFNEVFEKVFSVIRHQL